MGKIGEPGHVTHQQILKITSLEPGGVFLYGKRLIKYAIMGKVPKQHDSYLTNWILLRGPPYIARYGGRCGGGPSNELMIS
jgi:hypothetical protein